MVVLSPRDNFVRDNAPYGSCRLYDAPSNTFGYNALTFELVQEKFVEYVHASGYGRVKRNLRIDKDMDYDETSCSRLINALFVNAKIYVGNSLDQN